MKSEPIELGLNVLLSSLVAVVLSLRLCLVLFENTDNSNENATLNKQRVHIFLFYISLPIVEQWCQTIQYVTTKM